LFMVGTLAMVLAGIGSRLTGWFVPGTDAYAGYCMAAAGFLAVAHTFRRDEHIRVTLVLEHLGPTARRRLELCALAAGTVLAIAFAFYSTRLAYQSWDFNDVSTGNDATPLWIPQLAMAAGTIVMTGRQITWIARNALPMFWLMIAAVILIWFVPPLVTFLPQQMKLG